MKGEVMTDDTAQNLRAALEDAQREHEAIEDIFEEDTDADSANVEYYGEAVEVTLFYKTNPVLP